ncbi:MAG: prolyl-tRNA synthetase associated domain-containing protein [Ruminococcaceae bacterium]|nr:prolyl-tRNA synthetase associated domain-containing protein [Oscillospiraceae bacterium]
MILQKGRPENTSGREEKEIKVYDLLDTLGIEYYRVDHAPAMSIEDCVEIDKTLGAIMCKNLFLCNRNRSSFYLLMMSGEKMLVTRELSDKLGSSRLHFGKAEDMERLLDLVPGSVSVTGLMNDKDNKVRLLIDSTLLDADFIGIHPSVNTSSLRISIKDLTEKIIPALGHEPWILEI